MDADRSTPDALWIGSGFVSTPVGLRLSFQRYVRSETGLVPVPLPSSLGALPCGLGTDAALLIPLAHSEAFWIGLRLGAGVSAIRLEIGVVSAGVRIASVTADVDASGGRIDGFADASGALLSFARDAARSGRGGSVGSCCERLECVVTAILEDKPQAACSAVFRLVGPDDFERESGLAAPAPIDSAAGYRGYLLP